MALITKDVLREAFEAGRLDDGRSFDAWFAQQFQCIDCGRTTEHEHMHRCPARCPAETPYRGVGWVPWR